MNQIYLTFLKKCLIILSYSKLLKQKEAGEHYNLYKREGHLDIEKMLSSDYLLQFFAAFVFSGVGQNGKSFVDRREIVYFSARAQRQYRTTGEGNWCAAV